jgi:flap endonuclease-1
MGVKFQKIVPTTTLPLADLKGKTVAIDGMNMLYQILYNPFQMQQKLPDIFYRDRTQRVITHLYGWIQKVTKLYAAKIFPVIVFDGKPDELKHQGQVDRARNFLHLQGLYEKALKQNQTNNAKLIALNKQYMFTQCLHESKILLEAMGIPVIMAPSEAEAQCVAIQKQGLVDYIVTKDYDGLLFGASRIIRQLTFQTRKKIGRKWQTFTPHLEHISLRQTLQTLRINRAQLIDLAILIGCDYFKGIPNIGPKTGLTAMHKYHRIEEMQHAHPNLFTNLSGFKLQRVRNLFWNPVVQTITPTQIHLKPFNRVGIEHLLLKDHKLNSDRVQKRLKTLETKYKTFTKFWGIDAIALQEHQSLTEFDIHLQRRLDRGKKKNTPLDTPSLVFTPASQVSPNRKKIAKKPQKKAKKSSSTPVAYFSIKDYLKKPIRK